MAMMKDNANTNEVGALYLHWQRQCNKSMTDTVQQMRQRPTSFQVHWELVMHVVAQKKALGWCCKKRSSWVKSCCCNWSMLIILGLVPSATGKGPIMSNVPPPAASTRGLLMMESVVNHSNWSTASLKGLWRWCCSSLWSLPFHLNCSNSGHLVCRDDNTDVEDIGTYTVHWSWHFPDTHEWLSPGRSGPSYRAPPLRYTNLWPLVVVPLLWQL